ADCSRTSSNLCSTGPYGAPNCPRCDDGLSAELGTVSPPNAYVSFQLTYIAPRNPTPAAAILMNISDFAGDFISRTWAVSSLTGTIPDTELLLTEHHYRIQATISDVGCSSPTYDRGETENYHLYVGHVTVSPHPPCSDWAVWLWGHDVSTPT